MAHWALMTSYKNMETLVKHTHQWCSDFCHRLRYIISVDYNRQQVMLGGAGEIVEIDETLFAKVNIKINQN